MTTWSDSADGRRAWAREVYGLVERLPAPQASALRLIYFQHLSIAETARLTRLTISEVNAAAAAALIQIAAGATPTA